MIKTIIQMIMAMSFLVIDDKPIAISLMVLSTAWVAYDLWRAKR